jgi:hypothetical protein
VPRSMEKTTTSVKRSLADHNDSIRTEIPNNSRSFSEDQFLAVAYCLCTPPSTTWRSDTQHTFNNVACTNIRQPCKLVIPEKTSGPHHIEMVLPPPDIACLSCSGGNSRCPDQRPCGDCTDNGLECIWKGFEPKPK